MKNLTINTLRILAIAASILIYLSSCSVIKHKAKSKTADNEKTELDSLVKTDTKTTTKTTESADTSVLVHGSNLHGKKLVTGFVSPLVIEDELQIITVSIENGTVKVDGQVKDKIVPIKFKKITEKTEDKKITAEVKTKTEKKSETQASTADVKRSGIPWWIWLLLIIVGAAILGLKILKMYSKI